MAVYRKEGVLTSLKVIYSDILRENLHDDSPAGTLGSQTEEMNAWMPCDSLEIYHINGLVVSLYRKWMVGGAESGSKPFTLFDTN